MNSTAVVALALGALGALVGLLLVAARMRFSVKTFVQDFPTQGGGAVVALLLILVTGLVIATRLAMGLEFPDGYEPWIYVLLALAGVSTAGMGIKRVTDYNYAKIKTQGPSPVNVEAGDVTVETGDRGG